MPNFKCACNVNGNTVECKSVGKIIIAQPTYVACLHPCLREDVTSTISYHIQPGGALRSVFVFDVGDICTCPETLQPCLGSKRILIFFASVSEASFHVPCDATASCVCFGRLYNRVGMVEVFHKPIPPSTVLDVLIMVAARKSRLNNRSARGKVSHAQ